MQHPSRPVSADSLRRLILGLAFAFGLVAALAPHTGNVRAAERHGDVLAQTGTPTPGTQSPDPAVQNAPAIPAAPTVPDVKAPDSSASDAADGDDDTADDEGSKAAGSRNHAIVIEKGGKRIRVEGLGRDREYDSFEQFVRDAPWLAGLAFLSVLLVFLVPLLIIVLLIWYKLRKNRLANETMLKLAERGVVPTATAMDAVASGNASALAAATKPLSSPAYDQARFLHRRTVWSDLRKGVILGGIGLGLTFFSMLDDGTPNSVGLIFLFVGIGYGLLWFFEDRSSEARQDPPSAPPPGAA